MDIDQVNKRIEDIEKTVGAIIPMVATAGAMIRLVGGLVRGKMSSEQQKTFEQAITELEAQNITLQDAINRLRAASGETTDEPASTSDHSGG